MQIIFVMGSSHFCFKMMGRRGAGGVGTLSERSKRMGGGRDSFQYKHPKSLQPSPPSLQHDVLKSFQRPPSPPSMTKKHGMKSQDPILRSNTSGRKHVAQKIPATYKASFNEMQYLFKSITLRLPSIM